MIITVLTVLGIAALIVAHEWGHFWAAKKFNLKVEEFGVGFPPRIFKKKRGETIYSLNWLPLGGFVKIAGEGELEEDLKDVSEADKKRLFFYQKPWKKALVVVAGVSMNLILGWLILTAVFLIGTPQGIAINEVQEASPAATVGLKANDIIIGYGGEPIQKIEDHGKNTTIPPVRQFISFTTENRGKEITLLVRSTIGERVVLVTPRLNPEPNQGSLGIRLTDIGIPRQNLPNALTKSFAQTKIIVYLTTQSLFDLLKSLFIEAQVPEGVVGPVGIFHFAQETGGINIVYLLHLLAIISLNLAVLNLIPFPALDGGHLLFILIEKLKGSPLKRHTKLIANTAGVGLLVLLMLTLTFRDIQRIFFS
ncbi:MAG: site-2 protease family protein [Patescibacteria group bacterium]